MLPTLNTLNRRLSAELVSTHTNTDESESIGEDDGDAEDAVCFVGSSLTLSHVIRNSNRRFRIQADAAVSFGEGGDALLEEDYSLRAKVHKRRSMSKSSPRGRPPAETVAQDKKPLSLKRKDSERQPVSSLPPPRTTDTSSASAPVLSSSAPTAVPALGFTSGTIGGSASASSSSTTNLLGGSVGMSVSASSVSNGAGNSPMIGAARPRKSGKASSFSVASFRKKFTGSGNTVPATPPPTPKEADLQAAPPSPK